MRRRVFWGASLALAGCHRTPDPEWLAAPTATEDVTITWDGASVPGTLPAAAESGGVWSLYFIGLEGSIQGSLLATSEDGLAFTLSSSHRVNDALVEDADDAALGNAVYDSGSTIHLISTAVHGGTTGIWHGEATDGETFTWGKKALWESSDGPSAATGALFEPGLAMVALQTETSGGDPAVSVATSEDGGDTWTEPAAAWAPDDIPTPWGSTTVGAGGVWAATIVPGWEQGYHMLYLGAGPNGKAPLGIGQAWSDDGLTWVGTGELWYAAPEGVVLDGLSVLKAEDTLWVYVSGTPAGGDPVEDGGFFRLQVP